MRRAATASLLLLSGCSLFAPRPVVVANPAYVVGAPYQAGGIWRYPREQFDLDDSGLARTAASHPALTANGELYDAGAPAAGHRTLQLPAIARITNLENGRELLVRINDRGPTDPARLVELTPRAATLLAAADPQAVRVRVQVLDAPSRQVAQLAQASGPAAVPVAVAAPRGGVQAEPLAAPAGAATRTARTAASLPQAMAATPPPPAAPVTLTGQVLQGQPRPGSLAIDCGGFGRREYAEIMRARLASLGAQVTTDYAAPRERAFRVGIAGLPGVAAAEAMLARALSAGATDARIVVE